MSGTFQERTAILLDNPGGGILRGSIVFDQIYARFQHEKLNLQHPRGGGPKYLTRALDELGIGVFAFIAGGVLRGEANNRMVSGTERVARKAEANAPVEFRNLRRSSAVRVTDRGRVTYYRPGTPRLSEAAIEAERGGRGHPYGRRRRRG